MIENVSGVVSVAQARTRIEEHIGAPPRPLRAEWGTSTTQRRAAAAAVAEAPTARILTPEEREARRRRRVRSA